MEPDSHAARNDRRNSRALVLFVTFLLTLPFILWLANRAGTESLWAQLRVLIFNR